MKCTPFSLLLSGNVTLGSVPARPLPAVCTRCPGPRIGTRGENHRLGLTHSRAAIGPRITGAPLRQAWLWTSEKRITHGPSLIWHRQHLARAQSHTPVSLLSPFRSQGVSYLPSEASRHTPSAISASDELAENTPGPFFIVRLSPNCGMTWVGCRLSMLPHTRPGQEHTPLSQSL